MAVWAGLSELGFTSRRKFWHMLLQALREAAAAEADIFTKLLHVALTGVAHPLQSLLYGLNPRLTWR
jgi:hypothetical protein